MTRFKLLLGDRRRRQRGSVLSGLLIIVAFLSILVGALMTELTSSFLVSRALVTRVDSEATVTSAVELGIQQLKNSVVPPVCATDPRGPWFMTLNGHPAAVTQACSAIVPDAAVGLDAGASSVDGVHDTTAGANRYLLADSSGRLYAYSFGQTSPTWSMSLGGPPTGRAFTKSDSTGSVDLLVPVASPRSGCNNHCVALYNENGGTPSLVCSMLASATVTGQPAAEVTVGGRTNFPAYAFFGDSGGNIYAFNASENGGCIELATGNSPGSRMVGAPLVFPNAVSNGGDTVSDEVFVLATDSTHTLLQDWRYSETTDSDCERSCGVSVLMTLEGSLTLTGVVGGNAVGYSTNSTVPPLSLVVAGATGQLGVARVGVGSGPFFYGMSRAGVFTTVPGGGGIGRKPYWCVCGGQNLIGVGSTNHTLYLFNSSLNLLYQFNSPAAINSAPVADLNGDWYFGADDGLVYDVEVPTSGSQLFMAARFGPGGAIRSSPIVGSTADGCSSGPCLYFASSTAGSYFVQLGGTRVIDLRACVTASVGSVGCTANPRLWARVEVGLPALVGARGIYVQGWSYYSP